MLLAERCGKQMSCSAMDAHTVCVIDYMVARAGERNGQVAIGNVAVMTAAAGVFASHSHWPDFAAAVLIAGLNVRAATQVTRLALAELRPPGDECDTPSGSPVGSQVS